MDSILQDIRYSARKLMKSPGFTGIAVMTLAIAIGATTSVFSIVNGVLLKPLPYPNPEQIAFIASTGRTGDVNAMSTSDFLDYRDQSKSFVGMAPMGSAIMNVTSSAAEPMRVRAARVGASFFDLMGVKAQVGRTFVPGEDRDSAQRVVVLAHRYWQAQHGADARVVGQALRLDGQSYTIVGVAPASLQYPSNIDVIVPFVFESWQLDPDNRGSHTHFALGRVKDGITMAEAAGELEGIAKRLATQYPETNTGFGGTAIALQERIVGRSDKPLYAIFGAVMLVLLIACANIANLLLVRASSRESELAVRTALGAGRSRIIRQLMVESVLLSVTSAVIGIALASWVVDAVVAFGPAGLPRLAEVTVDGRVLAFSVGIGLFTGLMFGLVPALHVSRPDIAQMLRDSLRGTSRGGAQRTRSALIIGEMALAVVLLVGAGLLIRSFVRLINVDPGFNPGQVVAFNVSLPSAKYQYERDVRSVVARIEERMRQMPGAKDVGVTFGRPLDNSGMIRTDFEVRGMAPSTPDNRRLSMVHMTTPGYFSTLRIPLKRGRYFTEADNRPGAPPVIVVSEEFARRHFPGDDAVGKFLTYGMVHDTAEAGAGADTVRGEVVGVVGEVKQRDLSTPTFPATYVPFNKWALGFFSVMVRSDADPRALMSSVKGAMREIDRDLPIFGLTTMEQAVSDSVAQPRFYMVLLATFAGIALLLAAVGIYGVISYLVSQRTRELGIRVALGATRLSIVRHVVAQGAALALVGLVIGIVASLALAKTASSMVFGIGVLDPVTLAFAPLVLLGAALLGCYIPARRAARVDPIVSMRSE